MAPKLSQDERDIIDVLVSGFLNHNNDIGVNDIPNIRVFVDLFDEDNHCPTAYTGEPGKRPIVVVSFENRWACRSTNGLFDWILWRDYALSEVL